MPAVAIPLITAGIGAAGNAYSSHKAASLQQQQQQAQQPLINASTALANQTGAQSRQLFSAGMPLVGQTGSYYSQLLNGNRSMLRAATTPERMEISQQYSGADRAVEHAGLRGPQRDEALAENARARAGALGSLLPTARANAAAASGNLGMALTGQAASGAGQASSIYSGLLGNAQATNKLNMEQSQYNDKQSQAFGQALSGLFTTTYGAYDQWKKAKAANAGSNANPTYGAGGMGGQVSY